MIPFLKSVARAYANRYADLSGFCFLFPNKRSGAFFLKYLREETSGRVIIAPEVKSITDFVSDLSGLIPASRLDALLTLFACYRDMYAEKTSAGGTVEIAEPDFDSFRSWGETLVSDFNETDLYLADADELFKNVKDYRDISSNFLTTEQKEIMTEYFGYTEYGSSSRFWKNFEEGEKSLLKKKFMYLWRIMAPLYHELNRRLSDKGLAVTGHMYRRALSRLKSEGRDAVPYQRIVAVGFNALSTAEWTLFSTIQQFTPSPGMESYTDFFWDATGPVFKDGGNSASKFVAANIKRFPCPEWAYPTLAQSHTEEMPPVINVVASPSNSAQTKIAGKMISSLAEKLDSKYIADARVAVVLADENLLLPMLYSLPKKIGDVNLTMGYPLKLTSVVPFVSLIRRAAANRRSENGLPAFYHKELRQILSHSFTHILLSTDNVNRITGCLDRLHKSTVTVKELKDFIASKCRDHDYDPILELLGKTVFAKDCLEALENLDSLLLAVTDALRSSSGAYLKESLEKKHIEKYRDALRRVRELLEEFKITMKPASAFRLVDRLIAPEKISFKGEPLSGLQVMGTLETRSLDFEHIFILSNNERILPMRMRTKSFIPDSLRRAFGMPPSYYAEGIFAYYFFRMISRAKEVTLLYDSRAGSGTRNGGESRYIHQLRHIFAKNIINETDWRFILTAKRPTDSTIIKNDPILEKLNPFKAPVHYRDDSPGKVDRSKTKFISASALKEYRHCQISFFYKYCLGLNLDAPKSEFIDNIGAGNILHEVMASIYLKGRKTGSLLIPPITVTPDDIRAILADGEQLEKMVIRAVNHQHFGKSLSDPAVDSPLVGGIELVARQIQRQIERILQHDATVAPFRVLGCEIEESGSLTIPSGKNINFKVKIDRLDEITENGECILRIVDYKSGDSKLSAPDIETLVFGDENNPGNDSGEHAFQLLVYAWLHRALSGETATVKTRMEIYSAKQPAGMGTAVPSISKQKITDYNSIASEFEEAATRLVDNIFSDPVFRPAPDPETCVGCALKTFCRK